MSNQDGQYKSIKRIDDLQDVSLGEKIQIEDSSTKGVFAGEVLKGCIKYNTKTLRILDESSGDGMIRFIDHPFKLDNTIDCYAIYNSSIHISNAPCYAKLIRMEAPTQ